MSISNFAQIFNSNTDESASIIDITRTTGEPTIQHFGGFTIRRWSNLVVIGIGESNKGRQPVELVGFERVAGLLNAMMKYTDQPDQFSTLNKTQHLYASAAGRSYSDNAGYALVAEKNNALAGLPTNTWYALRIESGGYASAGAIRPVSYNQSKTWKTEEARDENEHKHHIVNLHSGYNMILDMLEGGISISFNMWDWSEKSQAVIADKLFAMTQGKSYRDELKAEASLRSAIAEGAHIVKKAAAVGMVNVDKEVMVTYRNAMMEDITVPLAGMVGLKVKIVQHNGSALNAQYRLHTQEMVAYYWKMVQDMTKGAYLLEIE